MSQKLFNGVMLYLDEIHFLDPNDSATNPMNPTETTKNQKTKIPHLDLRGVEWVHGLFLFPIVLGKI